MASSRIALVVGITLLAATTVFSQDAQKEPPLPQGTASNISQSNSSASTGVRTRVGANVAAAHLVHQVSPVYPPLAKTAHISGTVVLHVIIATDGTIKDLQYVSGPPLLMKSAIDAVQQWVYRPTLVNGSPAVLPPSQTIDSSLDVQKEAATTQNPTAANPEPNASAPKPKRIRVGGAVASANLIHQVAPVYPKDAKKQRITGTVLLHATIGHDGTVENLEYVSGPPELTLSALEAVKQWRYKPTLLNGDPVQVDTTISVVYTLGNH